MTIDKFGRSSKSSEKNVKGPKGDGFDMTADGHYDIKSKRLTNIGEAVESLDAVSKLYVDSRLIPLESGGFNLGSKRMRNVDDALEGKDAINLQTLKRMCLTRGEDSEFDAGKKQINNLGVPRHPRDAATKRFVENICLKEHSALTASLEILREDLRLFKERLAKCEGLIASNKDYHDKNLRKFGVLLYNYINKKETGRSATIPIGGEKDFINWEVLFADHSVAKKSGAEEEVRPLPPNSYDLFIDEELNRPST